MNEVDAFQVLIVIGVLVLIIRNVRKDKSDGRDMLGGGRTVDPKSQRK